MNIFNYVYDFLFENIAFGGLFIIFVLFVIWFVFIYNSLVAWKHRVKEAWSDIDVQLKRRLDLIPNLVESVKAYMSHEKQTLENVTKARTALMNASNAKEYAQADNMLEGALKSLFAVAENYPDLKASQNFIELQRELADTENKIQAARRFYNATVRDYNIKVQSFPSNIVANLFAFKPEEYFEIDESEKKVAQKPVDVNFNN